MENFDHSTTLRQNNMWEFGNIILMNIVVILKTSAECKVGNSVKSIKSHTFKLGTTKSTVLVL